MNSSETFYDLPDELRDGLRALKPVFAMGAIMRGMEKGAAYMVGKITEDRLTGKGPFPVADHRLGVVTGMLRRSFHWAGAARVNGNEVTTEIGANVVYAAAHEFGYVGAVTVKEHVRKTKKGGAATVKEHERKVNIPERAPIRTGIAEHADQMVIAIKDEILGELDRKN